MSQTFFLTGCASGMGRHMTNALQQRGDRVFATDLNLEALQATAEELHWPKERVTLAALDVTNAENWEQVFAEAVAAFDYIDVIMNFAGLLLASYADESPIREIDAQIDVNVKGVIYGSRVAARHMVARRQGHIINIASIAGLVPAPGLSTYCASKFAVRAYSLSAAMELKPKGVAVTAVCPASVQTPMFDNQLHNDAAEMFYSGLKILTLQDIEHVLLNKVLTRRPYEVHLPWLKSKFAQFVNVFPYVGPMFTPIYLWMGRRRQAQRRSGVQDS